MKFGLFRLESGKLKNKWILVSERKYSSYEIAAYVFMDRIIAAKGNLFIRRCV